MNSLLNIFLDEAKDDKLFADIDNMSKTKSTKNKKADTIDDKESKDDSTDTGEADSTTDDTNEDDSNANVDDTSTDDLGDSEDDSTTDDANVDDTSTDDLGDSEDDSTTDDDNMGDDSSDNEDNSSDVKLKSKVLLKSFVNLYNDIDEIIDRIDSADKYDDKVESITLNRTSNNLKRIKEILFDYIKSIYTTKSYDENLYYYHYILNSTKITKKIFDKIIEIRGKA